MRSSHIRAFGLAAVMSSIVAGTAHSGDSGADIKKAMKQKSSGTYYLKTNIPYLQGRHAYGTFKRPW